MQIEHESNDRAVFAHNGEGRVVRGEPTTTVTLVLDCDLVFATWLQECSRTGADPFGYGVVGTAERTMAALGEQRLMTAREALVVILDNEGILPK